MSAGDVLLDAEGNRMLDVGGNVMLDDGAGNVCCCGNGSGSGTLPPACDCAQLGTLSTSYHAAPAGFAACPQCDTPCSIAGEVWDGSLSNGGGDICQWGNSHSCDTTTDGLQLNVFLTLVTNEGDNCFWRLEVYCQQAGNYVLIWRGEKHTGGTPVGDYPQIIIAGCADGPASVTVS